MEYFIESMAALAAQSPTGADRDAQPGLEPF